MAREMACVLSTLLQTKQPVMITSVEIAKILRGKNASKKAKGGFDDAILGLGIHIADKSTKKQNK